MTQQLSDLLPAVVQIAEQAGAEILRIYNDPEAFDISQKDDKSPLTAADLAAHRCIVTQLQQLTPDFPILSEEAANIPYSERQRWPRYWLVDPLDGTKEFIKRNGEFTVNIALIDDQHSVLGVVHVPVTGVTYSAAFGLGAFKADKTTAAQPISSQSWQPGQVVRLASSRSHAQAKMQQFLQQLPAYELIPMGSSLKFCLIAEGGADVYARLGPTSEWDTAAAQCVVEQAGGAITDLTGMPLRYNAKESILNPWFLVVGDKQVDWLAYVPLENESAK